MLEQFLESDNRLGSGSGRGKFLVTTAMLVAVMLLNGVLWSLFARDLGIGNGDFELSGLVLPIASTDPPPPEPVKQNDRQEQSQRTELPTRQDNIARIDEMQPIPETISNSSNGQKARPNGAFRISSGPESDGVGPSGAVRGGEASSIGVTNDVPRKIDDDKTISEVPPAKKKVVAETAPKQISKGVITGLAIKLPKPTYPPAARAIHAGGDVSVQVTIDEYGNVISANAVNGHPLLKKVSEEAARSAKFSPTRLSDQPVKVTGIIVYKFSLQ